MDSYVPLVIVAIIFLIFVLYRFRPAFSTGGGGAAARAALRDAKARLEKATTDGERAAALADAADASARTGKTTGAVGYYLRAMRLDPKSTALVERAAASLARYPHSLETLLWRRLGAEVWTGPTAAPAHAALKHLADLYAEGPLRHSVRARAFAHLLEALGAPGPKKITPHSIPPEA
jgi:hypothetical protein